MRTNLHSSLRRQQLIRECPILSNIEPKQIKVRFQNRSHHHARVPSWLVMQGRVGDAKMVLERISDSLQEAHLRLTDIKEAAGLPEDCYNEIVEVKKEDRGDRGVWKEMLVHPTRPVLHITIAVLVSISRCECERMADGGEDIPRDAKVVKELLKSMSVEDYEPRVVQQFLELWYRYVVDVLTDAHVYSEHAGKSTVDSDDVKLAIQSKVNFSFSQPPPREVLLELARSRNKVPLPKSLSGAGIPLPPEQDTLISPNYQLAIPKRQISLPAEETEEDEDPIPNPNPNPNQDTQDQIDLPQGTPQRVSFPLGPKNPR